MLAKSPQEFYDTMAAVYRDKTGFDPAAASDIGIRMKVLSEELSHLTGEAAAIWQNTFPQTAAGEALDRHAASRGLARKPALPAGGTLRFYRATPATAEIPIPAGTVCAADGDLRFETTAPGAIKIGETACDLPAVAQVTEEAGNIPPDSIKTILSGITGVSGVTNPLSLAGGTPAELDEALRSRLMRVISDPPAVANEAFYREVALNFPGVRSAKVFPGQRGPGTIDIAVAFRAECDSSKSLESLRDAFYEVCPTGVDLSVTTAPETVCEIAALVVIGQHAERNAVLAACKTALSVHLAGLEVGDDLRLAALTACLMNVDGVENTRFVQPTADVAVPAGGLAVASAIDVERVGSL